jgi:hypothetical protein
MGILNLFSRKKPILQVVPLPGGTFAVDPQGNILTSTLPQWFPADRARDIGKRVLATFKEASDCELPLTEMTIQYGAFKITARELRGGALIYLAVPQTSASSPSPL